MPPLVVMFDQSLANELYKKAKALTQRRKAAKERKEKLFAGSLHLCPASAGCAFGFGSCMLNLLCADFYSIPLDVEHDGQFFFLKFFG